jgi:hypothetical protein
MPSKAEKAWAALEMAEQALYGTEDGPDQERAFADIQTKKNILRPQIKEEKNKRRKSRLVIIAIGIILLGVFIPKILLGTTIIALLKEVMTGEYKKVNEILDHILGIKK